MDKQLTAEEGELAIDLYKKDNALILEAAIGGIKPEDIDVEVMPDAVIVRGSRHRDHETKREHYIVNECHWGSFSREIDLPSTVNSDLAEATIKGGVLRVVMPLE